MLVVIAIIALLLALIQPALKNAKGAARTVECVSNMRQIYYGVQMSVIDTKLAGGGSLDPTTWVGLVTPHVEDGAEVLVCPEDLDFVAGDSSDYYMSVWGWPASWWNGAAVAGWDGKFPLAEGPRTKQIETLSNGYVLAFEDWDAVNPSWDDLILEVTFNQGETTLTVRSVNTAGNFGLLDTEGNEIWVNLKNKIGESFSFVGGGASSYGMSNAITTKVLRSRSPRVMLIDYEKTLVSVTGAGATDDWQDYVDTHTGLHSFARHGMERLNVMYTDGSVLHRGIHDIHPDISGNLQDQWVPAGQF
jgi:hypothetical protein